jgi:NitT/TauT family transport system substrate-binding protein
MKNVKSIKTLTISAALALSVSGIATSSSWAADSGASGNIQARTAMVPKPGALKAPEQKNVIVQGASPAPNIGYLPLYVGQKMGYFKDEGLEVKVNYSHGDSAPLQAINAGQAQIMSGTPEALIRGYQNGLRGVLFYQTYKKLIFSVAVAKDGKIKSPADLAGKTIGVSSIASTGVIIAKVLARDAGIDEKSVKFLPVGTGQQALGALKSGQVDALALWDSAYSQIEAAGDLKLVYWQPKRLANVGDGGYFTSWKLIASQPNTLAHFTRAMAKSMVLIHTDPKKALQIYWSVNPSAKPKGSEDKAMEIGLKQLEVVGRSLDISGVPKSVDKASFNSYVQVFKDQGLIKTAPSADDIVTNAFVPIAQQAAEEASKAMAK